ncbi:MAG: flagellar basal body-associated FliL family protein [Dechloromonas sp.]|nr:flagellar basal body-associated FliL family protein [Dechloromonas sp.]
MNVWSRYGKILAILLCLMFAGGAVPAYASSDAGGGGPETLIFTVNAGKENYLQFGLVLETATPEAQHALSTLKPRLLHAIILLLSGQDVAHLRTLQGKKDLSADLVETANQVIDETEKTGVRDALFTRFIIQ